VIDVVRKAYPDHAILAEESGELPGTSAEYCWVIDPLDGTTNFIHGFPQYCVSIAIQQGGKPVHAVIYDPSKNELFTASRGRGAFLNDRRIRVTRCRRLEDALVGTGFPFRELSRLEPYMGSSDGSWDRARACGAPAQRRSTSRMLPPGGSTLSGRWACRPGTWRQVRLLILEAGGLVGDFSGDSGYLESGDIAAGTPKVFPQLLQALQ
jgi:myo-inositol-1(or 4)-monophosphatase